MPAMRIDVHHHLFPPAYIAKLVESDHYLARGVAREWTPQVSIEDMDAAGVATAITSITAPGFAIVAPELRFKLHVERSLEEIGYALDTLKADGIGLLTSYGNKWLGDPIFAPVMAELDRRKCVVYVHPTAPDCCRNLLPGVPDWVIEFPADTTRTVASLLFSGSVERCRNIRFIFAHVGGVLPLL